LDPVIKKRGNMEKYWESNQNTDKIDPKFVKKIGNDFSNNKLMERLNCELDFRINSDMPKNFEDRSDDIIKPYSNDDNGNFKDFQKYSVPTLDKKITSFSSKL